MAKPMSFEARGAKPPDLDETTEDILGCTVTDEELEAACGLQKMVPTVVGVTNCFTCPAAVPNAYTRDG
jgi:hypothetical protein